MEAIQYFLRMPKSLKMGHFKLASGMHSNVYVQCAQVLCDPDMATSLGQLLASKFDHLSPDLVISIIQGGPLIGQEVGRSLNRLHYFFEKDDGKLVLRRDFEISPGSKVVIIEDVCTTASSALKAYNAVQDKYRGVVVGIGSIINRMGISKQEWPADIKTSVTLNSLIDLTDPAIITKLPTQFGDPFQIDPEKCLLCKQQVPLEQPGSGRDGQQQS